MTSNPSRQRLLCILFALVLLVLLQPSGGTWAWLYNVRWLYVLVLSFVISYLLVPVAIRLAFSFKILDYPNERKIHAQPIPRLGGLAIVTAVVFSTVRNSQFSPALVGLLSGSLVMYVLGLIDDVRSLPASVRLLFQAVACTVVIASGVVLHVIPFSWPGSEALNALLTVIWLIGMSNAINFLDGVDGLATGLVAICSLFIFLIAWHTGQTYWAFLTISVVGACIGFLPYNWKPARIFLGDAGSTFLGFLVSGLAIMGTWAFDHPIVAISSPLLVLGIPIFDMIYTTISRAHNGLIHNVKEWLEYAGRDHFHHRLMYLGLTEKQTVLFIWGLNVCLGLGGLLIRGTDPLGSFILLFQSVLIFLMVTVLMILGKKAADRTETGWRAINEDF